MTDDNDIRSMNNLEKPKSVEVKWPPHSLSLSISSFIEPMRAELIAERRKKIIKFIDFSVGLMK